MIDAHVVVGSNVAAFQHCPERLHAVGVSLPVHVLSDRVLDGLVVRYTGVAGVFVGVDLYTILNAVLYERLERRLVGVLWE